jgi:hypothetical protein
MVMTSGGELDLGGLPLPACTPLQIHVICDVFRCGMCAVIVPTMTRAVFCRKGMESKDSFNFSSAIGVKAPPSPWLIFHVHGGGFVAQSRHVCVFLRFCTTTQPSASLICVSKSHESYLLTWSRSSGGVPGKHSPLHTNPCQSIIGFTLKLLRLSAVAAVNYDLAPQKQFPTQVFTRTPLYSQSCHVTVALQLHQCLHAWAWVRQNASSFGWTGERCGTLHRVFIFCAVC